MRPNVRTMLDRIETMLLKGDTDAKHLEAILTALRGPDRDDIFSTAKTNHTIPVRRCAFPQLASGPAQPTWMAFNGSSTLYDCAPGSSYDAGSHYASHILRANRAIRARKRSAS